DRAVASELALLHHQLVIARLSRRLAHLLGHRRDRPDRLVTVGVAFVDGGGDLVDEAVEPDDRPGGTQAAERPDERFGRRLAELLARIAHENVLLSWTFCRGRPISRAGLDRGGRPGVVDHSGDDGVPAWEVGAANSTPDGWGANCMINQMNL